MSKYGIQMNQKHYNHSLQQQRESDILSDSPFCWPPNFPYAHFTVAPLILPVLINRGKYKELYR